MVMYHLAFNPGGLNHGEVSITVKLLSVDQDTFIKVVLQLFPLGGGVCSQNVIMKYEKCKESGQEEGHGILKR